MRKTSKKSRQSPKEKRIEKIADKRTELVTEYFSKPPKTRKRKIEEEIAGLDEEYEQLHY